MHLVFFDHAFVVRFLSPKKRE